MQVAGHVKNGVVIPDVGCDWPDDTKVWVVPITQDRDDEDPANRLRRFREEVLRIAALPMEGPGGFSGRDHDKALYGAP